MLYITLLRCKFNRQLLDSDRMEAKLSRENKSTGRLYSQMDGFCVINYKTQCQTIDHQLKETIGSKFYSLLSLFLIQGQQYTPMSKFINVMQDLPYETGRLGCARSVLLYCR